ncbi:MAG: hypothetical protein L6Q38_03985, partial [Nitrospira sp.]|nr:hypothetical protein [Nitrospira sp.]
TSFPNELDDLARAAKHLTPQLLAGELAKLDRPQVPVYAYHLKPRFRERIGQELKDLGIEGLSVLEEGQTLLL